MDYEKKYKEALEKARQLCAYPTTKPFISDLQDLFPELKESEDERIRKELLSVVNDLVLPDEQQSHFVTWLEKQQKPANLKTKAGNWYTCDKEVMNENMVTAFHRGEIYYCPKDGYLDVSGALFEVGGLDVFRLVTEEEIPQTQPKQEWSGEDCNRISSIKYVLHELDNYNFDNWLDSLKERYVWKPSDEQMLAISTAIGVLGKGTINGKYLIELQEQLLKLMEE